jgi:hypothetical protein
MENRTVRGAKIVRLSGLRYNISTHHKFATTTMSNKGICELSAKPCKPNDIRPQRPGFVALIASMEEIGNVALSEGTNIEDTGYVDNTIAPPAVAFISPLIIIKTALMLNKINAQFSVFFICHQPSVFVVLLKFYI